MTRKPVQTAATGSEAGMGEGLTDEGLPEAGAMDPGVAGTWTRRRTLVAGLILTGAPMLQPQAAAAQTIEDVLRGVIAAQGPTQLEADQGLRQALTNGAISAVTRLGRTDGYFKDLKVQIPLPTALHRVQETLRPLGLSGPLDDLQMRMNRGAEQAAPKARNLFVSVIREFTIEDAMTILRGGDDSATRFLRAKTETGLKKAFQPIMTGALRDAGALSIFERVAARYVPRAEARSARDSLIAFAVDKAMDGLFYYIAEEERAIRRDPVKRTTAILRKVFGAV